MKEQALTTAPPKLSKRLFYFLGIGSTSALTHIMVVLCIVAYIQPQPLIANIFGFLIAFNISFFGHKYLTFSQLQEEKQLSLPHFFIVAASGGIINESLYFLFLRYTDLNYLVALVLVLMMVAIYSYLLSRYWACR